MKGLFVLCFVAAALAISTEYQDFMMKFGKHYDSTRELRRREKIFLDNLAYLAEKHKEPGNEWMGVTKFFDMTKEEFRALLSPRAPTQLAEACLLDGDYAEQVPKDLMTHPDSFDWRDTPNVVLSVKDQASCGSCWAFSTVEAIEGQNGIANNAMAGVDLSPQYVVDCSKGCSSEMYMGSNITVCNGGCNGGWPWTAFNDLATPNGIEGGGVPSWTSYPYTGYTGACKTPTAPLSKISGYDCVCLDSAGDEDDMAEYLYNKGPLSIAIDADPFYYYSSGVIPASSCPIPTVWLNHAILLVGYNGLSGSNPYWIVKNSWGTSFGQAGYAYISYGQGTCGINAGVSAAKL